MRDFFAPTSQTTTADAHAYLKRVLPTLRLEDDLEYRGYKVDKEDVNGCKAVMVLESRRISERTDRLRIKEERYLLNFADLVDVRGDSNKIELIGKMVVQNFVSETGGSRPDRETEFRSYPTTLDLMLTSEPFDIAKAFKFLSRKCGGGAGFAY